MMKKFTRKDLKIKFGINDSLIDFLENNSDVEYVNKNISISSENIDEDLSESIPNNKKIKLGKEIIS